MRSHECERGTHECVRHSMSRQQALAWGAHLFTSLGLVAAAGIAMLIVRGSDNAFRTAFGLMLVATLIDALDGSIARMVHVKEVLPHFDGRRLDDIIDFHTYTSLPLLLVWRAGILPGEWSVLLLFPLLASAFGFSRIAAKTADGYFLGFPSYWNIVAFYLYFLGPPAWLSIAVITLLSLLTFVPSRYLYPTQPGALNRFTNVLGAVWAVMLVWILASTPEQRRTLVFVSLFFPLYYMAASWWVSLRASRGVALLVL
jgi:phosphatidylcholine synthase